MPILRDLEIDVQLHDLLMLLGAKPERVQLYEQMLELSQNVLAELPSLVRPAAIYDVFDVSHAEPARLVLRDGHAFESHIVATQLAQAQQIAVAVCTIGPLVEEQSSRAFDEGRSLEGLVLDNAGSLALDCLSLAVVKHLQNVAASRGLQASVSIQPGSRDSALEDQAVIRELLPTEEIDVTLTEGLLLKPLKSLSLLVGYGHDMPEPEQVLQCHGCPRRQDCAFAHLRERECV